MAEFSFQQAFLQTFHDEIINIKCMSLTQLGLYNTAWTLFQQYQKLSENIANQTMKSQKNHVRFELEKLESYFLAVNLTPRGVEKKIAHNYSQRLEEITNEMMRIKTMLSFYRLKNKAEKLETEEEELDEIFARINMELVEKINQFNGDVKNRIEDGFTQLNKYLSA